MFANLPESLQEEIRFLLSIDNFPAAKELYENFLNQVRVAQVNSAKSTQPQQNNTAEVGLI